MRPDISVVVPLFNEAGNVQPLSRRILETLGAGARPIELIMVDDASTDETWDRILSAQKSDPPERAERNRSNFGQGASRYGGFSASQEKMFTALHGH